MDKLEPSPKDIMPNREPITNPEKERQARVSKILELVEKINESGESLPFPGINPEAYLKMKAVDAEFPGYTTPIDNIIDRCKKEGIKIILGKDPDSGNVFVLPAGSNDIEMDSISPHQLEIGAVENIHLRELIQLTTKKHLSLHPNPAT